MPILPYPVAKAVCYVRKSREDEQAELRGEDTLRTQRTMLYTDVLSRYTFPCDLAEEVASGDSIRDRPVFRSLLPQLGDRYQAVVCKDLSRLGRGSYSDMGVLYDILRDRRVLVITKDAVYDPGNFSDLRMIRFSLFFNREEYEMTLWRLTEGKNDGAAQGKWVAGSAPYGCQYNPRTQTLEPCIPEASVVQLVFTWYTDEGLGCRAIATRLTRMGYRTPKGLATWHPEVVRRMLRNPAYHGTLVFRATRRNKLDGKVVKRPQSDRIVVENAFDALVSPLTWAKAQRRLATHESRPRVKPGCEAWELASVVRCSACRHKLIRQSSQQHYRRKDGGLSVYDKEFLYCSTCGYAVKYRDCESQLITVLTHLRIPTREELGEIVQGVGRTQQPAHHPATAQLEERQQKLLASRLYRARELLLDGTLTKEEYLDLKHRYSDALQTLSAAPANQTGKAGEPADYARELCNWMHELTTLADVYRKLQGTELKNRLLRQVFRSVQLRLIRKSHGRNRPSQFDLDTELVPSWAGRWTP